MKNDITLIEYNRLDVEFTARLYRQFNKPPRPNWATYDLAYAVWWFALRCRWDTAVSWAFIPSWWSWRYPRLFVFCNNVVELVEGFAWWVISNHPPAGCGK